MTDPVIPPFEVDRGAPAQRLHVVDTFSWHEFRFTFAVEVPTNPGGAYTTTVTGVLHQPDDGDGQQVWALTIALPLGAGRRDVTIEKKVTAPGWREAVEYAQARGEDIAARVAVAAEARRLFNDGVGAWTAEHHSYPLGDLDIAEGIGDALLAQIGNAYSGRYRVESDPFDTRGADPDEDAAGQGVN